MDLQSRVIFTTKAHKAKLIYFGRSCAIDDPPNVDMCAQCWYYSVAHFVTDRMGHTSRWSKLNLQL